jgi:hypothetical protein
MENGKKPLAGTLYETVLRPSEIARVTDAPLKASESMAARAAAERVEVGNTEEELPEVLSGRSTRGIFAQRAVD